MISEENINKTLGKPKKTKRILLNFGFKKETILKNKKTKKQNYGHHPPPAHRPQA